MKKTMQLIKATDPPPWTLVTADNPTPLLLLCDHASNLIPAQLDQLGLPDSALQEHIAYDIGCYDLSREIAKRINCNLLLAGYSRLVIDLNRHPGDGSSIPEVSDVTEIPGNRGLSPTAISMRENELFWSYHNQVDTQLERIQNSGLAPIICSIHSFTPVFRGFSRPWHIGVLWDRDKRLASPMLHALRDHDQLCVGDNEPYHARNPLGYTMDIHGERKGHMHVLLEVRQDLIDTHQGASRWADIITDALAVSFKQLSIQI